MGTLEKVLRAGMGAEEGDRRWRGVTAAFATGFAVGVPVAFALALASVAFVCTTVGTVLAVRARTTGRAVAWVFGWNLLPPTLIFAPTLIGLVYAVPAGLIAVAAVLPVALLARRAAERPDRVEREHVLASVLTVASAAGLWALLSLEAWEYEPELNLLTVLVATLAAFGFAGTALARELGRAWLALRAKLAGWKLAPAGEGLLVATRGRTLGEGPHRAAEHVEELGLVRVSGARLAASLLLTELAATLVVMATLTLLH